MTSPVFFTSNDTSNAGRCSHSAVLLPAPTGVGSPAAHAASSALNVPSASCTLRTDKPEYEKFVYDSPKPNSKRGAILACSEILEPPRRHRTTSHT